jgi:isoquinoline 1-oxidoreductase alpha subunit
MAGNLCRCATYVRIRAGIHRAADIASASTASTSAAGKGKK